MKLCALLVLFYVPDAHAWGLQTHVFLAQYALAAIPLVDPELRAAARRLPRLVLAGACLPDLAVIGRFFLGSAVFRRSHLWATLRRIAASPHNDPHRALALGYATHLVSDVVAHNEFVPEHEARFGRTAMIGHLVSEWAMDRYLRPRVRPAEALEEAGLHAVEFVARAGRATTRSLPWRENKLDAALRGVLRSLISYMVEDPRTISSCLDMLFVAKSFERIGDHATNIFEHVIYAVRGENLRHVSSPFSSQ